MDNNKIEMQGHLDRNEKVWKLWGEYGVNPNTELTVNFHFYASKKQNMDLLCKELSDADIIYRVRQTRTLIFLKGWKIEADITKKWTLPELQGKTGYMFVLSKQVGVSLEGGGALIK